MAVRALLASVVTGLALALALPTPALAAPAPLAASSGVNDFSCRPSAAHPSPVVLLHGLSSNKDANWGLHGPKIAAAGYCVFSLTYGEQYPNSGGWVPIAESAQEIGAFVDEVLDATDAETVDLVGHSEGAFHTLYVPKVTGYASKVSRVVALAPPTHGTSVQGLVTLGRTLGGQELVDLITDGATCRACGDLVVGGAAVEELNDGPIALPGIDYTVIATRNDQVVTPPSTSFVREPGVTNYYVQDECPADPVGHVGIAADPGVTSMILHGLDPDQPVRCGFGPAF